MRSKVVAQEVIKTNNGYVFVSTVKAFGHGLETMVFTCDANGEVTNWFGLEEDRYYCYEDAINGHNKIASKYRQP